MKTATKTINVEQLEKLENNIIAIEEGMKALLENYNVEIYEDLPENGKLIYDGMYKNFKSLCDFSNRIASVLSDSSRYIFQELQ